MLALVACSVRSSQVPARPSPRPAPSSAASLLPAVESPTPAPAPSALIALMETRAANLTSYGPLVQHDTAVLARPDLTALARSAFQPRVTDLYVGNAAPVLPPYDAYLVGGKLYFVDGAGSVQSLSPGGQLAILARFPIGASQQEVSFAVSPDGSRIWGARLTLPAKGPIVPPAAVPTLTGPLKVQLLSGTSDSDPTVIREWQSDDSSGQGGFQNLTLVGWDSRGPIALIGNALAAQTSWLAGQRIFAGHLSHLDSQGQPSDAITPDDCLPYSISASIVICYSRDPTVTGSRFKVLKTTGEAIWAWTPAPPGPSAIAGEFALSPDGRWMAMTGAVVGRDNSARGLPPNFHPQGWLGADSLFGRLDVPGRAGGNAAVLRLADTQHPIDLQFQGDLVDVSRG
jgi:hypothetical protein